MEQFQGVLAEGLLKSDKSVIIATYALCGFSNFASIGIQIGGIGSLAPGQRRTLTEFGIKALIGNTIEFKTFPKIIEDEINIIQCFG